ncbi:hypothetical protein OEW28_16630 [Defluviimonas sp. WL0002]|uniref:Uncharacterized protein n=1 Tax=Albidovulum marisflavi TaxID=2984159 RepID=A0ABT2ZGL7_9RHOB|nr:hypothetical protein [Defluviimonas sp. WL0002]MCV2870251.1 hypothetical protein [Defluviimonas sp. WL0002]
MIEVIIVVFSLRPIDLLMSAERPKDGVVELAHRERAFVATVTNVVIGPALAGGPSARRFAIN